MTEQMTEATPPTEQQAPPAEPPAPAEPPQQAEPPKAPEPPPPAPEPARSDRAELGDQLRELELRNDELAKALESETTRQRQSARELAAADLGVLPAYRKFVPDTIDARTAEGRAELEKWAQAHPEVMTPRAEPVRVEIKTEGAKNPLLQGAAGQRWAERMRRNNGL